MTGNETEAGIYRKVHNYLVPNIEYDYDALQNPDSYPEAFTIQGIFERKKPYAREYQKHLSYYVIELVQAMYML